VSLIVRTLSFNSSHILCIKINHFYLTEGNNEVVEGLAFDPVSQALLWTDESKLSIQQLNLDHDESSTNSTKAAELVHFLRGDRPRALMTDPCNR